MSCTTVFLITGVKVSFGYKNEENRAPLPDLDSSQVEGEIVLGIKKDMKLNKNNISVV